MYAIVQITRIPKQKMGAAAGRILAIVREVPLVNFAGTTEKSGSLFAEQPIRRSPMIKRRSAPELQAARALCHQLRHIQTRPDKARLVHLICLNLMSILKHRSPQA